MNTETDEPTGSRAVQTLERRLARLRRQHTEQTRVQDWPGATATNRLIIRTLDRLMQHDPEWREGGAAGRSIMGLGK